MIWLAWRQLRGGVLAAAGMLAAVAVVLVMSRPDLSAELQAACTSTGGGGSNVCSVLGQQFFDDHQTALLAVTGLLMVLPGAVGLFRGAPLIAREFETGTHRLVWNQSVTRPRWLVVKLAVVGLAAVLVAAAGTLLVTWWASALDQVGDLARIEPLLFATRGIAPVGYAAFALALALGVTIGLVVRRTLPAMAITAAVFAAVQVLMPLVAREHLLAPVREMIEISDSNAQRFDLVRVGPDRVAVRRGDSGAWLLSASVVDRDGNEVDGMGVSRSSPCREREGDNREGCFADMTELGYRLEVSYHPDSHYWPLQWREAALYVALALGLAGFCLWRIRRPT